MKKRTARWACRKTIVSLLFCAQHHVHHESLNHATQTRKKKNMETRIHTHTHIQHNPEEASSSETTLCIYCIRGQSHSLPFLRTVYTQAETYTHTHTHTREHAQHTLPRLVFWPLKSFLLSFMLHTYTPFETNTPLFPSCSRLARSPLREPSREPCEQLSSESL